SGRDLEGEPHARRPLAVLEHDRLLPWLGRQDRAALLLDNDAQADDARVIVELALEIGRGQRRMPNSLDLQHRNSPRPECNRPRAERLRVATSKSRAKSNRSRCSSVYPPARWARTDTDISPIGSIRASMVSPGLTGLTPSGVPV